MEEEQLEQVRLNPSSELRDSALGIAPPGETDSLEVEDESHKIKKGFVFGMALIVAIGMLQFGFALGSWNLLQDSFKTNIGQEWSKSTASMWSIVLTNATILGAMISSLSASIYLKYGKYNMILVMNGFILVGTGLCMVEVMWVIALGRFVIGIAAGAFSVMCPQFLAELAPSEIKGPIGTINQLMVCMGICIPAWMAIPIPTDTELHKTEWIITSYWRYIWFMPAIFCCIQMIGLFTCFKFTSPVELKKDNQMDKLRELMGKIYDEDIVESRIEAIPGVGKVQDEVKMTDSVLEGKEYEFAQSLVDQQVDESWGEVLCRTYKYSTWMAAMLCIFQQFSGMNAIVFYSSTIFNKVGVNANIGTAAAQTMSMLSVFGCSIMLKCAGRRTLMSLWFGVLAILSVGMSYFSVEQEKHDGTPSGKAYGYGELAFVVLFVSVFQFAPGPVVWLYNAEICTTKGLTFAATVNWTGTLIIGFITPPLLDPSGLGNYAFLLFAVCNVVASLFCFFIMKETRGLTAKEVGALYLKKEA